MYICTNNAFQKYKYNYSVKICALCVQCSVKICALYVQCSVKCVLCQYKEDNGGHRQESQQYDDHDTYTSPQRIVL